MLLLSCSEKKEEKTEVQTPAQALTQSSQSASERTANNLLKQKSNTTEQNANSQDSSQVSQQDKLLTQNPEPEPLAQGANSTESSTSEQNASSEHNPEPAVEGQSNSPQEESVSTNQVAKNIFSLHGDYDVDGINPFDIVLGNKDSNVKLIVYTSLTCPACAYYHEKIFGKIKEKYIDTNKIAYILRLSVVNKQDLDGATLALCDRAKFNQFVDVLYSRQQSWAFNKNYAETLGIIGKLGGVDADQYRLCLLDDKIREGLILQTKKLQEKFGSRPIATPSFIINGTVINNGNSANVLSAAIDKLLAQ